MNKLIYFGLIGLILFSCKEKTTYYKYIDTGIIYSEAEFQNFKDSITSIYYNDSLSFAINTTLKKKYSAHDSIIQPFGLNVRVGEKYVLLSSNYDEVFNRIGNQIPKIDLKTIHNYSFTSEDLMKKPTLLNVWFINCPPCMEEIPELNKLQNKYKDKINFISLTFEPEKKVREFLTKTEFNFEHITDAQSIIDSLGIKAFPKNIFIDTDLTIRIVEGGLGENHYTFEHHLEKLLSETAK